MNDNLLKAILSMDVYNRGYNAGINLTESENTQIATVAISSSKGDPEAVASNFYAIAYEINGTTDKIVSYRGTDDYVGEALTWGDGDVLTGWGIWSINERGSIK